MSYKKKQLQEVGWSTLKRNPDWHDFDGKERWDEEFESLGEVSQDGTRTYLTRKNHGEPFKPGNLCLVNLESPEDWERICDRAICLEDH